MDTAWAVAVIRAVMAKGYDEATARAICKAADQSMRVLHAEGIGADFAAIHAVSEWRHRKVAAA